MCNAWNHPPGCNCGWGGEGHKGRREGNNAVGTWSPRSWWAGHAGSGTETWRSIGSTSSARSAPSLVGMVFRSASNAKALAGGRHYRKYETYITPNACCPVCRQKVFFYQSPDGGRVFFDALGPPWPKHPCTDNLHPVRRVHTNLYT